MHPPRRVFDTEECVFEWPERYAHWHSMVVVSMIEDQSASTYEQRWPRAPGPKPRLIVCRDPEDAAHELAARGLRADPRVPRTFPALRLAIVPLPVDDGLLAALESPPSSWLESLRHEWHHLLLAGRAGPVAAPLWFQEGLAERANLRAQACWAAAWPIPEPGARPAEILHQIWAFWADQAMIRGPAAAPWTWAEALAPEQAERVLAELRASVARPDGDPAAALWRWRGRDAEAEDRLGRYLAAPLPGQIVEVDLPPLLPGAAVEYELSTGISGLPDAGLRLPLGPEEVFLRCDAGGGLAAWAAARGATPANHSTDRAAADALGGAPRVVRIEHRGASLAILAADGFLFRHRLPADAAGRPLPLLLYARGGVFAARRLP